MTLRGVVDEAALDHFRSLLERLDRGEPVTRPRDGWPATIRADARERWIGYGGDDASGCAVCVLTAHGSRKLAIPGGLKGERGWRPMLWALRADGLALDVAADEIGMTAADVIAQWGDLMQAHRAHQSPPDDLLAEVARERMRQTLTRLIDLLEARLEAAATAETEWADAVSARRTA